MKQSTTTTKIKDLRPLEREASMLERDRVKCIIIERVTGLALISIKMKAMTLLVIKIMMSTNMLNRIISSMVSKIKIKINTTLLLMVRI